MALLLMLLLLLLRLVTMLMLLQVALQIGRSFVSCFTWRGDQISTNECHWTARLGQRL